MSRKSQKKDSPAPPPPIAAAEDTCKECGAVGEKCEQHGRCLGCQGCATCDLENWSKFAESQSAPASVPSAARSYDQLSNDELKKLPFFGMLEIVPPDSWGQQKCTVHLYRTGPKIENTGKYKYIRVYMEPVTLDDIKQEHGGGSYRADFNDRARVLMRSEFFPIEGDPKFKQGQKIVDEATNKVVAIVNAEGKAIPVDVSAAAPPADAAAVRPTPAGDLAAVMAGMADMQRQMLDVVQRLTAGNNGSSTIVEAVRQANQISLELVAGAAKRAADGDSNAQKELIQLLKDQAGNKGGVLGQINDMVALMTALEKLRPKEKSIADQVTELRTVFPHLFVNPDAEGTEDEDDAEPRRRRNPPANVTDLVLGVADRVMGGLVQQLPSLAGNWFTLKKYDLDTKNRELSIKSGKPDPGIPAAAAPAAIPAPTQPALPAGTHPTEANQMSMIDHALQKIAECVAGVWNADANGYQAARAVIHTFPDAIMFQDRLKDVAQITKFASEHPALHDIARDSEFPKFVQQFCKGCAANTPEELEALIDGADDEPEEPAPVPPSAS